MRYYKVNGTSKPLYVFVEESSLVWLSNVPYKDNAEVPSDRLFAKGLSAILSKLCEKPGETVLYKELEDVYIKTQEAKRKGKYYEFCGNIVTIINNYRCGTIKDKYVTPGYITYDDAKKITENVSATGYKIDAQEVDDAGKPLKKASPKNEKGSGTADIASNYSSKKSLMPTVPANRFHYRSGALGFFGRTEEFEFLKNMCFDSARFCWIGICGESGIGKSRLTFELCKTIEAEEDWTVFHLSHAKSTDMVKTKIVNSNENILVCFDDAMADIKNISDFFDYCYDIPEEFAGKIRLILIDRDFNDLPEFMPGYFEYLYTASNSRLLNKDGFISLDALLSDALLKIMQDYIKLYYPTHYPIKDDESVFLYNAIEHMDKKLPLHALLIVDAWCNGDDIRKWDREKGLKWVKDREYGKASDYIKQEISRPTRQLNMLSAFKFSVAITVFSDPVNMNDIDPFLTEYYNVSVQDEEFVFVLKQMGMLQDNIIKKIYPDAINEYICIDYINSLKHDTMLDITELIFSISDETVLIPITILCNDYEDILKRPSNMSVFQYMKEELEVSIGEIITSRCSEDELSEFDKIDNTNCAKKWLEQHVPDYVNIVNEKRKYWYQYFSLLREHKLKLFEFEVSENKYGSYHGDKVLGWRCGQGVQDYTDGSFYEGEWNKNTWNGSGTYIDLKRGTYKGEFLDGIFNGKGTFEFNAGGIFEGNWVKGHWHGLGKLQLEDGTIYDGEFLDGVFKGYEITKKADGTVIKKEISNMRYSNDGLYFSDGRIIKVDDTNDA